MSDKPTFQFTVEHVFDSLDALTRARAHPVNMDIIEHSHRDGRGCSWWGGNCRTIEDVTDRIRRGWPGGLRKLRETADKVAASAPRIKHARRRPRRGREGNELDIHAVNRGALDRAWRKVVKEDTFRGNARARRVRIVVDLCASASRKGDELFWRPAAALIVAERLLASGHSVEIVGTFGVHNLAANTSKGGDSGSLLCSVLLKPFDRPLNLESLAVVALAGLFRGPGFHVLANFPRCVRHGLGAMLRASRYEGNFERQDVATIVCEELWEERQTVRWVEDTLANLHGTDTRNRAA